MSRLVDDQWGQRSPSARPQRVAETIRRELAQPIQALARDRGLGIVTLSDVSVSPDLRSATIYITQMGPAVSHKEVLAKLRPQLPELRTIVARNIRLRYTPHLSIRFDESVERGARIDELLRDDREAGSSRIDDPDA